MQTGLADPGTGKEVPPGIKGKEMSAVQKPGKIRAILCSDLHFSDKRPPARDHGEMWYAVMADYIKQLVALKEKWGCPVVAAGDIFHNWNSPPALINFLIDHLPEMYAIPGQHDLPNHSLGYIHRSSYWTLVKVGKIKHLEWQLPVQVPNSNLILHGFPYGTEIIPIHYAGMAEENKIHLAVAHSYIWQTKANNPAKLDNQTYIYSYSNRLKGYTAAVFGDNHKGFLTMVSPDQMIFNCGTFIRRRADEIDYSPRVGLLRSDGSIESVKLDTSSDRFTEFQSQSTILNNDGDIENFLVELTEMKDAAINFHDAVMAYFKTYKVSEKTKRLILEALEKNNGEG